MNAVSVRRTRRVWVGHVPIGGGSPVSVQAMTKCRTQDVDATVRQVDLLAAVGAAIVRIAVPDHESAHAFGEIRKRVSVPLVADIHFDHTIALKCLDAGADKLRINPGNLGPKQNLVAVAKAAGQRRVPIRVGVNAGSLESRLLQRFGGPCAEALAESALQSAAALLDVGFEDIVISAKSSDVMTCVDAYRLIASRCDWPLHIGITETGPGTAGVVKSVAGISLLLAEGIGDTLRVSLSAAAEEEVRVGQLLLRSLGLGGTGVDIIACPTCGRARAPILHIADEVQRALEKLKVSLRVAVMACEVNGPGEAREADIGLAATRQGAVLFEKGEVVATGTLDEITAQLIERAKAFDARARM